MINYPNIAKKIKKTTYWVLFYNLKLNFDYFISRKASINSIKQVRQHHRDSGALFLRVVVDTS
jgi:hypothetical protein